MGIRIAQREQGEHPRMWPNFFRHGREACLGWESDGIVLESSPAVPWFRNTRPYPWPSRAVSGIVFESSTGCIETPPDVANPLAKSAFRYISRRLDTRQPDLGSGAARRGGSSLSSCTVVGAFSPAPLKCPPSGITKRVIQRGPTPDFWGPDPKRSCSHRRKAWGSSLSPCTTKLRSRVVLH